MVTHRFCNAELEIRFLYLAPSPLQICYNDYMWYALIFISFLDISHLQLDLENEYVSRRECLEATATQAETLLDAVHENLGPLQANLVPRPKVVYSCQYIDLRKA